MVNGGNEGDNWEDCGRQSNEEKSRWKEGKPRRKIEDGLRSENIASSPFEDPPCHLGEKTYSYTFNNVTALSQVIAPLFLEIQEQRDLAIYRTGRNWKAACMCTAPVAPTLKSREKGSVGSTG